MRIAFFGLPIAALLLAADGHEIVYAAICRRGAIGSRRLRAGVRNTFVVPDANREETATLVRASSPDLIVSWFWTKRLPARILALAPAIGVHPSLLPRHRGPDPYFWAIHEGDAQTGVTAHLLEERYDTGAMLGSIALGIDPTWSAWTLAKKLDRPSLALLRRVARAYARGEPPEPVAQDERHATQAPEPSDDELAIDWTKPAPVIERLVRAASPWPGATFTLADEPLALERVAVTRNFPRALEPGEAAVRQDGIAVVRAGEGAVELLRGRDGDDVVLDADALATRVALAVR